MHTPFASECCHLRKRTIIISNAPWMSDLRCESMTPERRFEGLGCDFWWIHLLLHQVKLWRNIVGIHSTADFVRHQLRQIQEMKRIKMVKKYVDSRGRNRVVGNLFLRTGLNPQNIQTPAIFRVQLYVVLLGVGFLDLKPFFSVGKLDEFSFLKYSPLAWGRRRKPLRIPNISMAILIWSFLAEWLNSLFKSCSETCWESLNICELISFQSSIPFTYT